WAVGVPDALPAEQACLLACGFSTGAGATLWATPVPEGASVGVIGCGGVGLAAIQGARLAGAARIVAVDVVPEKLALALELGATDAVDASAGEAVAQVRKLTDGVVTRTIELEQVPDALEELHAPRGIRTVVLL